MKKDINYYRKLLHIDTITLLIIDLSFIIIGFILGTLLNSDDVVGIIVYSLLYLGFIITLLCNKKEIQKFVGYLCIFLGIIMFIPALFDGSLFSIVYLAFGIIYIIHSIKYLNAFKQENIIKDDTKEKILSKLLPILSIILNFITLLLIYKVFRHTPIIKLIVGIIFSVCAPIFSIISIKNKKNAYKYIILIISIYMSFMTIIGTIQKVKTEFINNNHCINQYYMK